MLDNFVQGFAEVLPLILAEASPENLHRQRYFYLHAFIKLTSTADTTQCCIYHFNDQTTRRMLDYCESTCLVLVGL